MDLSPRMNATPLDNEAYTAILNEPIQQLGRRSSSEDEPHQDLRARCVQLGMTSDALDGWSKFHVRPVVAMAFHFSAQVVNIGSVGYLFTGAPFTRFVYTVPYMVGFLLQLGHIAVGWRFGPGQGLTLNPFVKITYPAYMLCVLTPKFFSFLGPTDQVPFGSFIHYTAVVGVFQWTRMLINQNGFNHRQCPEQPHRTIMPQMLNGLAMAVRLVDCMTDMAFVRVLLHEKVIGCWWFGKFGRCEVYNILIAVLSICAIADFVMTTALVLSGPGSKLKKSRVVILVAHGFCMVCEIGVITVAGLEVASGSNPMETSSRKRQQMAAMLASLVTTCLTVLCTCMAAGNSFKAAKVVYAKSIPVAGGGSVWQVELPRCATEPRSPGRS